MPFFVQKMTQIMSDIAFNTDKIFKEEESLKKFNAKRVIAHILTIGVIATSVFPGTAYAAEVGEQVADTSEQLTENLGELASDIGAEQVDGIEQTEESQNDISKNNEDSGKTGSNTEEKSNVEQNQEERESDTVEPVEEPSIATAILISAMPEDLLGAISCEDRSGSFRLVYPSQEMAKTALDTYMSLGMVCEYDINVELPDQEPEKVDELNPAETPVETVDTVEDLKEEPVEVESVPKEKSVKVAVIDTGCDLTAIPGRIAEGTDQSITDANGHGTLMAEIIASQTTENVKILPMKVFDDTGVSTVGQVYSAIMSAIDFGVDVINLSMSGEGTSQMLTTAINMATEKGIIVVVAAGNEASDVNGFMPGNIEAAITVSATDKSEVFAEYSNFGSRIDYSAVGEIIKDQGTEDTSDDEYYSGTSVASAFVSGYAACIKDNNPEADVVGTFDRYAKDLGSAGRDDCYGRGFLTLEDIKFDIGEKGDLKEEHPDLNNGNENGENASDSNDEYENITDGEQTLFVGNYWKNNVYHVTDEDGLKAAFDHANADAGGDISIVLDDDITVKTYCLLLNKKDRSISINGKKHKITIGGTKGDKETGGSYFSKNEACIEAKKGTIALSDLTFDGDKRSGSHKSGNAVVATRGGTIFINQCVFKNVHYGSGVGINVIEGQSGTLKVSNTTIDSCVATGAISAWQGGNTVTCENVTITNGNKKGFGIAIAKQGKASKSEAIIKNCKISNVDKAIHISDDSPSVSGSCTATIEGTTVSNSMVGINVNNKQASASISKLDKTIGNITGNVTGVKNTGIVTISDTNIYGNSGNGITSSGTVILNSGNIYSNTGYGISSSGKATIYNGNIYENQKHGVNSSGDLKIHNGSFYGNGKGNTDGTYSGINSNGTLTIKGGCFRNNTSHGVAIGGGTANIYGGNFGTYSTDGGKTWVTNAGNINSGIRTKNAITNVYGGVYFYNNHGIECQSGSLNLKHDPADKNNTKKIYVSLNTNYGLHAKEEVLNVDKTVKTAGGNITVDANALVNSHSNGIASIYAGNKAKVTVKAGEYYNNPYGINATSGGTVTLSGGEIYGNKTYGVYNNGIFHMTGGKVRDNDDNGTAAGGNKVQGIYNKSGTVTVSGGTISGNSDGLYNIAKADITGGTVTDNDNGIRNNTDPNTGSSGTTTVNGTSVNITGNTRGIQNTATNNGITVNNANVTENTYDISQSGETFVISGSNTKADTIELGVKNGKCEVVTLNSVPTEKKTVVFARNYKDDSQNTKNITVGRPMFKCSGTTPKAILNSGNLVLQSGQKTLMDSAGTKRDAIMRPCVKTNSNDTSRNSSDYIVLSAKYAGIYKVKNALKNFKFEKPDDADIFWNEDNHITMPKLYAWIGGILKQVPILGWLKDGLGNPIKAGEIMSFLFGESNKDHDIVAQMGVVNLLIDGNEQTDGENYVIEEFNCETDILPQNTFKKEIVDDYYYIELEEQKRHVTKYSYQGWSLRNDVNYLYEGVMQPDGKLDFEKIAKYMEDNADTLTYGENGLPNIPIYAVWDKYPELEVKDISFAEAQLDQSLDYRGDCYKDDKAFADTLYERVQGTDAEDGTLTNGTEEVGVICEDSIQALREELLSFTHTGATTVTFKATDGVGNVTERRVRVWINRGTPIEEAYINRARAINRTYYDIGKVYADKLIEDNKNRSEKEKIGNYEINVARATLSGELDRSVKGEAYIEAHKNENEALAYMLGFNKGGLMPTDWWYTDPEYRKCIEDAFDNLENDTPEYSWKFTHEQVLETQEYVETYGISTSEHADALKNYFNKYKASFTKLK